MMTRRQALKATAVASAACATFSSIRVCAAPAESTAAAPSGPFTVPPLPYAFDALEPHIDARTMEIHHDKHRAAYVTNLNKALEGQADLQSQSLDDLLKNLDSIPENIRQAVRNNAGGHWNHSLFWTQLKKGGGGEPKGDLAAAIKSTFG